jgi:site-specific recombinase XerD
VRDVKMIHEALEQYLDALAAENRSKKTLQTYRWAIEQYTRWLSQHQQPLTLDQINLVRVRAFLRDRGEQLQPKSLALLTTALRAFGRWLADDGIYFDGDGENVLRRLKTPRVPMQLPKPLKPEEVERILAVVNKGRGFFAVRNRAIVHLLLDCGLRRGELCGLQLDDVDLMNRAVKVSWRSSKGYAERWVRFGRETTVVLRRWINVRGTEPGPLFLTSQRNGLAAKDLYDLIHALGRAAGVEKLHPHRFRHTWATTYHRTLRNVYYLRQEGGWSNERTPLVYTQINPVEDLKTAPSVLDTLVSSGRS